MFLRRLQRCQRRCHPENPLRQRRRDSSRMLKLQAHGTILKISPPRVRSRAMPSATLQGPSLNIQRYRVVTHRGPDNRGDSGKIGNQCCRCEEQAPESPHRVEEKAGDAALCARPAAGELNVLQCRARNAGTPRTHETSEAAILSNLDIQRAISPRPVEGTQDVQHRQQQLRMDHIVLLP